MLERVATFAGYTALTLITALAVLVLATWVSNRGGRS